MTEVTQADREAAANMVNPLDAQGLIRSGKRDDHPWVQAFAAHRAAGVAAERERCAGVAKTGWVSADYNTVGIADADVCMRLCEHIETVIRSGS